MLTRHPKCPRRLGRATESNALTGKRDETGNTVALGMRHAGPRPVRKRGVDASVAGGRGSILRSVRLLSIQHLCLARRRTASPPGAAFWEQGTTSRSRRRNALLNVNVSGMPSLPRHASEDWTRVSLADSQSRLRSVALLPDLSTCLRTDRRDSPAMNSFQRSRLVHDLSQRARCDRNCRPQTNPPGPAIWEQSAISRACQQNGHSMGNVSGIRFATPSGMSGVASGCRTNTKSV